MRYVKTLFLILYQERMSILSRTFMQVIFWKWKCAEGSEGREMKWVEDSLAVFSRGVSFFIFLYVFL